MTTIKNDLSTAPYYDRTNNELDKDYAKVLFVSGQRLNAMDLNASTGILQGQIRKVTDELLTDGSIISGCSFTNNKTTQICTLNSGKIYFNGYIVQIPETIWHYYEDDDAVNSIPNGNVIVWSKITSTIYTATDDSSLYNPSENYESFGDTGGHRLKYVAEIYVGDTDEYNEAVKNNKNIVPLLKIYNRECIGTVNSTGIYGNVSAEMAQRTYDQSGDFVATGMNVSSVIAQNDPKNKYKVSVSAGRCYVQGWQYKFNDNYIICDNSNINTNSTLVQNIPETITYNGYDNIYYLSHKYVKEIISVIGILSKDYSSQGTSSKFIYKVGNTSISLNNADDIEPDKIVGVEYINVVNSTDPNTVIAKLVNASEKRVAVDSSNKSYIAYDYEIKTTSGGGKSIVWNTNSGTQYTTNVLPISGYNNLQELLEDYPYLDVSVQYKSNISTDKYTVTYDKNGAYIKFSSDNKLSSYSDFDVNYSWYMPRIDLVYVSSTGRLCVKSGNATDTQTLTQPSTPLNALPLAYITVKPNTDANDYVVVQYGLFRIPIGELQSLKKRVDNLEYNATMTQLEQEVANAHTEQDKSGYYSLQNIYTDPVTDYSKADIYNKQFDATLDIYKNHIILPINVEEITFKDVTVIDSNNVTISSSDVITTCNFDNYDMGSTEDYYGRIDAKNTQLQATHSIDLTPYYCAGLIPTLSCDPVKIITNEPDDTTITVWLPAKIIYNAKYVNTVISTEKQYTGLTAVTYSLTNDTGIDLNNVIKQRN